MDRTQSIINRQDLMDRIRAHKDTLVYTDIPEMQRSITARLRQLEQHILGNTCPPMTLRAVLLQP